MEHVHLYIAKNLLILYPPSNLKFQNRYCHNNLDNVEILMVFDFMIFLQTFFKFSFVSDNCFYIVAFKGWIISEGILNIVPSSHKWTKSPSLIFQFKYRNSDLARFLEEIMTNLKITFEITPPSSWQGLVDRNFSSKSWMSSLFFWAFLLPIADGPLFSLRLQTKRIKNYFKWGFR